MVSICALCPAREDSFCNTVPDRELKAFAKQRNAVDFQRGQTLIVEGEQATSFFNVVSGVVKLLRSLPNGRTQIVGFRQAGEFFGSVEGETYSSSAVAITSGKLCRFSHSNLAHELRAFPQLYMRLLSMSFRQLAISQDHALILGRMTAREKVASFLMIYGYRSFRDSARPQRWAKLPMSRAEIADFLGLTIETVSRTLTSLANDEIIAVGRKSHSIQVIDPDALAHAVWSSPAK